MEKKALDDVWFPERTEFEQVWFGKTASDELSDLKKAIAAIKRDKWPVAKKLMKDMERKWRKDRDVYNILTVFEFHAEENDWSDHDKHGKKALRALERLEAAFKAGYPSMNGVKALKTAEKVCGKIKAESQGKAASEATLRNGLIRMAFEMPKGSDERRKILEVLKS